MTTPGGVGHVRQVAVILPDGLRTLSGGVYYNAKNGNDLLLVFLGERLDHHVAARSLPLVVLLEQHGVDHAHDGDLVREEPDKVGAVFRAVLRKKADKA